MRLALLSDIHGNPIALDAVLADIEAQGGVDGYWILGDVAAIGYDPVTVIERLVALPNGRFLRGNCDHYTVTGDPLTPTAADILKDPTRLPKLVEIVQSFAWTQGYVTAAGWLDWLAQLPLEQRMVLPDSTRLLAVHAAPGHYEGDGINPQLNDSQLRALLAGCQADLVCVGHTHVLLDRTVDGVRLINVGSVSNPTMPDLRASYVLLQASDAGYRLQVQRVAYDREAVIAAVEQSRHPAGDYIIQYMRGRLLSRWLH